MRHLSAVPCTALAVALTLASIPLRAADADFKNLDPKTISIRLPADIEWKSSPGGSETAALADEVADRAARLIDAVRQEMSS